MISRKVKVISLSCNCCRSARFLAGGETGINSKGRGASDGSVQRSWYISQQSIAEAPALCACKHSVLKIADSCLLVPRLFLEQEKEHLILCSTQWPASYAGCWDKDRTATFCHLTEAQNRSGQILQSFADYF